MVNVHFVVGKVNTKCHRIETRKHINCTNKGTKVLNLTLQFTNIVINKCESLDVFFTNHTDVGITFGKYVYRLCMAC